jgi:Na+-transporting methylmalonyl-CoA/oxaloacetate decarboxylase beta subunit
LLPIGLGCILANLPNTGLLDEGGLLNVLYKAGIENELFPSLIFIGIGAMTDFGPLLENPKYRAAWAPRRSLVSLVRMLIATLCSDSALIEAASIGIIGAADGPTSIFVAAQPGAGSGGPHHGGGLLVHVAGARDPAAGHAAADDAPASA